MNCEGDVLLKKRSNFIDLERLQAREGDSQFRRWEYWGHQNIYSCFFALQYTGDHTVYRAFSHRGTRGKKNPFVRSAPYVKEKVRKIDMINHCCVHAGKRGI